MAITRENIERVLAEHPKLHDLGYGETTGVGGQPVEQNREILLQPSAIEVINTMVGWIRQNLVARKAINKLRTSYGLKHLAEKDVGYSSNGEFIVAMLLSGYRMSGKPGYNPAFNVSETVVQRVRERVHGGMLRASVKS